MNISINELRQLVAEELATIGQTAGTLGDADVAENPIEAAIDALQAKHTKIQQALDQFNEDLEVLQRRQEQSQKGTEKKEAGEQAGTVTDILQGAGGEETP